MFECKIKSFQSDGGGEFTSYRLQNLLSQHGIYHRNSCPHTPEQNGEAERKHRHIVETGLALLAHCGVPLSFWDVAFDIAVFLINLMPTPILQGLSPYEKLFHTTPDYKIFRSFGCRCFPFIRLYMTGKLSFRTILCVFLGYGRNHKGYKCYDPVAKRFYMSRHVVFDETIYPLTMTNNSTPLSGPLFSAEHVLLGHIQLPASTTNAEGPAPTMTPGMNSVALVMYPSGLGPAQSTVDTIMLPSVMTPAQMSSQVTATTLHTPIRRPARRLTNAEPSSHEPSMGHLHSSPVVSAMSLPPKSTEQGLGTVARCSHSSDVPISELISEPKSTHQHTPIPHIDFGQQKSPGFAATIHRQFSTSGTIDLPLISDPTDQHLSNQTQGSIDAHAPSLRTLPQRTHVMWTRAMDGICKPKMLMATKYPLPTALTSYFSPIRTHMLLRR